MPITAPIPLPGSPGEAFFKGATVTQNILSNILAGRQNAQKLIQEQLANEQLNKYRQQQLAQQGLSNQQLNNYRMGSLGQQNLANEQLNKYRQQQLGVSKEELPSKIALHNAQADYYQMGGAGSGVDVKQQMALMKQAMRDNPGIDLDKSNQITNAWLHNSPTLSDGTPTPQPSGNASYLLDSIAKKRTTASQINQTLNAVGGEAEIEKLSKISQEWNKPYGDTYFNMSPSQIIDTFKSDSKSQDRLGDFIAGQQLQFEIAQIQNRIAMGQPGITNTQDLMNRGMQMIDARYPMLSQRARQRAQQRFTWALSEGLKARNKKGINAATAINAGKNEQEKGDKTNNRPTLKYNQKTGDFEEI